MRYHLGRKGQFTWLIIVVMIFIFFTTFLLILTFGALKKNLFERVALERDSIIHPSPVFRGPVFSNIIIIMTLITVLISSLAYVRYLFAKKYINHR